MENEKSSRRRASPILLREESKTGSSSCPGSLLGRRPVKLKHGVCQSLPLPSKDSRHKPVWEKLGEMKCKHRLDFNLNPKALVERAQGMRDTKALLEPLGGPVSEGTAWATLDLAGTRSSIRFESSDGGQSFHAFYLADPILAHEVGAGQFSTLLEDAIGQVDRRFKNLRLLSMGTQSVRLAHGTNVTIKQADVAYGHACVHKAETVNAQAVGPIVFEIAVQNESLPELIREGELWLRHESVKLVVLCKIVLPTEENSDVFIAPDIEFLICHRLPNGKTHISHPERLGAFGLPLEEDQTFLNICLGPIVEHSEDEERLGTTVVSMDLWMWRAKVYTCMGLPVDAIAGENQYNRGDYALKVLHAEAAKPNSNITVHWEVNCPELAFFSSKLWTEETMEE